MDSPSSRGTLRNRVSQKRCVSAVTIIWFFRDKSVGTNRRASACSTPTSRAADEPEPLIVSVRNSILPDLSPMRGPISMASAARATLVLLSAVQSAEWDRVPRCKKLVLIGRRRSPKSCDGTLGYGNWLGRFCKTLVLMLESCGKLSTETTTVNFSPDARNAG